MVGVLRVNFNVIFAKKSIFLIILFYGSICKDLLADISTDS